MSDTPEERARRAIDALLDRCGWIVQEKSAVNLSAARGVAVCELSFQTGEPAWAKPIKFLTISFPSCSKSLMGRYWHDRNSTSYRWFYFYLY